jgi:rhodanese-related sulfurtransferase
MASIEALNIPLNLSLIAKARPVQSASSIKGGNDMPRQQWGRAGSAVLVAILVSVVGIDAAAAQGSTIFQATIGESGQKTPEVSTEEVRRVLADGSAIVLDSRKRSEYVAGHIAGAKNVAPEAGAPPSAVVAAVEVLVGGDKGKALVLYCNGPHCQASRQLGEQLAAAGFSNVRRYQLGIPMWRTLSGPVEIELEGIQRIYGIDRTTVFFDARDPEDFTKGSLDGAHNVPVDKPGSLEKAPLPRDDFNTRVILFGRDGAQARKLADLIGKTPYQNVSFFPGTFEALAAALKAKAN